MKRFITNALIMGILSSGVVAALGSRPAAAAEPAKSPVNLYISYTDQDIIDVIDLATLKVVRTIKGIPMPHGILFSPDGKRLYAASESEKPGEQVLGIVDVATGKIIKKVPLSGVAHGNMTLTKDGKRLFVPAKSLPGGIDVIDTAAMERVRTIPMTNEMHDTILTPDQKYLVAGSTEGEFLTVVDVHTTEPVWEMKLDSPVQTLAAEAGPDGSTRRLLVNTHGYHGIRVVDFAKRQVVSSIALPETDRFRSNTIYKKPDGSPSHGIEITPDKKTLWQNSKWGDAVFVYSLPDFKLLGHVNVGKTPNWIVFSADGKTLYDGNSGERSLSVIDMQTMKEVKRIELKFPPRRFVEEPVVTLH